MKVYCPVLNKPPGNGKAFFAFRLAKQLKKMGVKVHSDPAKKHDITLAISYKTQPCRGKYILRLNGLHYATEKDYRNKPIAKSFKAADGIVYQSEFSRRLVGKFMRHLGAKTKAIETIIHNAADRKSFDKLEPVPRKHKYQVLCANRWRRHKRLKESLQAVLKLDMDIGVWVAGQTSRAIVHERIQYLGRLDQKTLGRYYKSADVVIHLCPYDNCPNSVVEAISANTPVLCINCGGTPELVGTENGVICNADTPFTFKPLDVNAVRPIHIGRVSKALQGMLLNPIEPNRASVGIVQCAEKYYKFFEKVLRG